MKRVILACFLLAGLVSGQGERSALNGTVTDSSGAAVPNAAVTATHVETGVEHKAVTTSTARARAGELPGTRQSGTGV
jgi:protocatechuate 3,4-dioxygenase beta subunit